MSYLHPNCSSFPLEDYVWWVSRGKTTRWWCAICGEKFDWRQLNRLLVVQTGESFEQAKVFKAHAVPQGLCVNLMPWRLESCAEAREHLRFGSQKLREGSSDVTVRESPDELTLRAEEVGISKAYIDVDHLNRKNGVLPWLMLTGMPFCQALYKGIEGKDWEEMYDSYKVMSKAVGV